MEAPVAGSMYAKACRKSGWWQVLCIKNRYERQEAYEVYKNAWMWK